MITFMDKETRETIDTWLPQQNAWGARIRANPQRAKSHAKKLADAENITVIVRFIPDPAFLDLPDITVKPQATIMTTAFRALYTTMFGHDPDDRTIPKHIRDFNKEELERTILRFPELYPDVRKDRPS